MKDFLLTCFWIFTSMLCCLNIGYSQPNNDYKLIYSDEFDGDKTLEGKGWRIQDCRTHLLGDPCETSMWYMKENVTQINGKLQIQARQEQQTCNGRLKNFTSGLLESPTDFLYGYFEIKASVPPGDGLWPAFWFWSGCSQDMYREIDVLEYCGCDCREYKASVHYENDFDNINGNDRNQSYCDILTSGGCLSFHTYGVEWTPEKLTFYFDGTEKFTFLNKRMNVPMPAILNLAIDGCWGGCGWEWPACDSFFGHYDGVCRVDCDTPFPANFDIEYFKVWKLRNEAITILSDNYPFEFCINESQIYYTPYIPGATHTWSSSPVGLVIENLSSPYWASDCKPAGPHDRVKVSASASGIYTMTLTTNFPTGYSESKSVTVSVGAQSPTTPTNITFTPIPEECCYTATAIGSNATSYEWNISGIDQNFYSFSNVFDSYCFPPNRTVKLSVRGNNFGCKSNFYTSSKYLPKIIGCGGNNPQLIAPIQESLLDFDESLLTYPNPVNSFFIILPNEKDTTEDKLIELTIYDVYSRVVLQGRYLAKSEIDVQAISNGLYYLVVKLENQRIRVASFVKDNGL